MTTTILEAKRKLAKTYKLGIDDLFPPVDGTVIDIPHIPAPSATINALTGCGGFPRGRITEIYGPEGTGKTTLAIEIIAAAQKNPQAVALFLDYEHAFDPRYARRLGVDLNPSRFIFAQPDTLEQGDAILDALVAEGLIDIGVVDSVAAMNPRSFQEGEIDKGFKDGKSHTGQVGLKAQLMSQMLNRLKSKANSGRKPALIFTNQVRTKLNLRYGTASPEATGGLALKYYASVRIELGRATGEDESGEDRKAIIDQRYRQCRVRMTCVKNKVGPPWLRSAMVIRFGSGISNIESVADLADMYCSLRKKGSSWYEYDGGTDETRLKVQGRPAFVAELSRRPALLKRLEEEALEKLRESNSEAEEVDLSDVGISTDLDPGSIDLDAASEEGPEAVREHAVPGGEAATDGDDALPVENAPREGAA